MDDDGRTTVWERISLLESAVALARREVSVAKLEFLAVTATGNMAEYAGVRARLVALGIVMAPRLRNLRSCMRSKRSGTRKGNGSGVIARHYKRRTAPTSTEGEAVLARAVRTEHWEPHHPHASD